MVKGLFKAKKRRALPTKQTPAAEDVDDEFLEDEDNQLMDLYGQSASFLASMSEKAIKKLPKETKAQKRKEPSVQQRKPREERSDDEDMSEGDSDVMSNEEDDEDDGLMRKYESRARTAKDDGDGQRKSGLPIKTADGSIVKRVIDVVKRDKQESASSDTSKSDDEGSSDINSEDGEPMEVEEVSLLTVKEAKDTLASLAETILENPEKNIALLGQLRELCVQNSTKVSKLAMLTELAVYKDILPSYRIRLATEKEKEMKVSKEVSELRDFEEALLAQYQIYLKFLDKVVRQNNEELMAIAVRCMGEMLKSRMDFNFSSNIIAVLVPKMNSKSDDIRKLAFTTLVYVFQNDSSGKVSLEIARLVAQMVKHKHYQTRPEAVDLFLHVPLFADLNDISPFTVVKKKELSKKQKWKLKKDKRKMQEEVEKSLREAEAEQSAEERRVVRTEILKTVFLVYFRTLKAAAAPKLLSPVLRGLGKFSHLLNVEFMADILESIKDLIADDRLTVENYFHCILAVFKILGGHGEALNVDPKDFHTYLYRLLLFLPEYQHLCDVACDCLQLMLNSRRQIDTERLGAFVKRISLVALYVPAHAAIGLLMVIRTITTRYTRTQQLMDNEQTASGAFIPDSTSPDHCNPFATACWELGLLKFSYHPYLRQFAQETAKCDLKSVQIAKYSPSQMLKLYDSSQGGFNPPIQTPRKVKAKTAKFTYRRLGFNDLWGHQQEGADPDPNWRRYYTEQSRYRENEELHREVAKLFRQRERFLNHLKTKKKSKAKKTKKKSA